MKNLFLGICYTFTFFLLTFGLGPTLDANGIMSITTMLCFQIIFTFVGIVYCIKDKFAINAFDGSSKSRSLTNSFVWTPLVLMGMMMVVSIMVVIFFKQHVIAFPKPVVLVAVYVTVYTIPACMILAVVAFTIDFWHDKAVKGEPAPIS